MLAYREPGGVMQREGVQTPIFFEDQWTPRQGLVAGNNRLWMDEVVRHPRMMIFSANATQHGFNKPQYVLAWGQTVGASGMNRTISGAPFIPKEQRRATPRVGRKTFGVHACVFHGGWGGGRGGGGSPAPYEYCGPLG